MKDSRMTAKALANVPEKGDSDMKTWTPEEMLAERPCGVSSAKELAAEWVSSENRSAKAAKAAKAARAAASASAAAATEVQAEWAAATRAAAAWEWAMMAEAMLMFIAMTGITLP